MNFASDRLTVVFLSDYELSSAVCLLTTKRPNHQMLPAGGVWQNKVLAIAQMRHWRLS